MKKLLLLFVVLLLASCNSKHETEKDTVFVSIAPQKYFVEQIAGNLVNVEVMVQPGNSPADYEPLPSQMIKLGEAKLYFSIGVPFEEAWLPKLKKQNAKLKIVPTDRNVPKIKIDEHSHDEHHHGEFDNHIWLDPERVKIQALNIAEALGNYDSYNAQLYNQNLAKFIDQLDSVKSEIDSILERKEHRSFLVYHPVLGYFADRFKLHQHAIEQDGKEPSPLQLKETIEFCRKHDIHTIYVQKEFSKKSAGVVASEIEGSIVELNPLAYNYLENLVSIAKALK